MLVGGMAVFFQAGDLGSILACRARLRKSRRAGVGRADVVAAWNSGTACFDPAVVRAEPGASVAKDQVIEGGGVNISISTSSSTIGSNVRRRATSSSAAR